MSKPDHLEPTRLLSALDAELQSKRDDDRDRGWSVWALAGAAGAVLWAGLKHLESSCVQWVNAGAFTLSICVICDAILLCAVYLEPLPRTRSITTRIFYLRWLDTSGASIATDAMRQLLLLSAAYYSLQIAPFPGALLMLFSTFQLIGSVGSFVALHRSVGFPVTTNFGRTFRVSTAITILSPLCAATLLLSMLPRPIAWADVKLAVLLTALSYLVPLLIERWRKPMALDDLRRIRRELAFGWIGADEAYRRAEQSIRGITIQEYLDSQIADVQTECRELSDHLKALTSDATNADSPRKENLDEISRAKAQLKSVRRRLRRFKYRVIMIRTISPSACADADRTIADMDAVLKKCGTTLASLER